MNGEEIERLRGLRGDELEREVMTSRWYAVPNDLIGGWGVALAPVSLAETGLFEIATFMTEANARHIAELHNQWLTHD